jgi:hypothetical protein
MPEVLLMDPHEADHVTSIVAANCNASFTTTVGLTGSISNAPGVVPDRFTFCGLPLPESENESVAVRVPLDAGLKTTLAEQLAFVARLVPQVVLLIAKSPAFVPLIATLLIEIVALVPFVSVADCATLGEPTEVAGNPSDVGDTVTLPPEVLLPVPERETV